MCQQFTMSKSFVGNPAESRSDEKIIARFVHIQVVNMPKTCGTNSFALNVYYALSHFIQRYTIIFIRIINLKRDLKKKKKNRLPILYIRIYITYEKYSYVNTFNAKNLTRAGGYPYCGRTFNLCQQKPWVKERLIIHLVSIREYRKEKEIGLKIIRKITYLNL